MGWFSPKPLELKFGEPVHLLVARALYCEAVKVSGDLVNNIDYHFVGPHGIEYKGDRKTWGDVPPLVAKLCEGVQQDFNERIAAMDKAREVARDSLSVPSLFGPVKEAESH